MDNLVIMKNKQKSVTKIPDGARSRPGLKFFAVYAISQILSNTRTCCSLVYKVKSIKQIDASAIRS